MTTEDILRALEKLGNPQTRKTLVRHGAVGPLFGVKIGDMKSLIKAHKNDHPLALGLYATGNSDAMYLAGLIADNDVVTKGQLNEWAKAAPWSLIANSTVAALAAESPHAVALARKWITSKKTLIASCGWSTFSHFLSIAPDSEIDAAEMEDLLERVVAEIHQEKNGIKEAMNGFVISLGASYPPLTGKAKAAAREIGKIEVDHGNTACKTPDALAYIEKIEGMGRIGKKRKSARC